MKNKHLILSLGAALLTLALAACAPSLLPPPPSAADPLDTPAVDGGSGTETAYRFFYPSAEAELSSAVQEGWASQNGIIVKTGPGFDPAAFSRRGATVDGFFDLEGQRYWHLSASGGTVKLVKNLRALRGVFFAEHELVSRIPEGAQGFDPEAAVQGPAPRSAASIAAVLNDPLCFGRFGHFETTRAIDAYRNLGFGANTVYVADIDTGINRLHEDLLDENGQQIVAFARSAFNSSDGGASFQFVGSGNPFVTVPEDENWDDEEHGSHTAGTIAARGNNGKGVAGVAWKQVRLISYKCFASANGSGSDWAVYNSLRDLVEWKIANGITQTIPVNMSLGGSMAGQFELEMINYALANDIVIIASMGNDGVVKSQYPAAYSGVIAVGATDGAGNKVHFSSMGPHISVSAPGYNIYSIGGFAPQQYTDMSGTSMAAPFVTGTVAYMLSFNPRLKLDQIKTILELTADDKAQPGWDEDYGYGQVNVYRAVARVKSGALPEPGRVYTTKTLSVAIRNTNANYDSGIPGASKAVAGQPVYLYKENGDFAALGVSDAASGTARFKLLKPGKYRARVNYFGQAQSVELCIGRDADASATLSFDLAILLAQTVPNLHFSQGASGADTALTVYDAANGAIVAGPFDQGALDSLVVAGLASGKTYLLSVMPYLANGVPLTGEYGLNVGFAVKDWIDQDPGRPENQDDSDGNQDPAHAKPIQLGTDYAEYLGADGEWFSFSLP